MSSLEGPTLKKILELYGVFLHNTTLLIYFLEIKGGIGLEGVGSRKQN